ncbi:uncharacterized protein LOC143926781 [Lithobates pipiens]
MRFCLSSGQSSAFSPALPPPFHAIIPGLSPVSSALPSAVPPPSFSISEDTVAQLSSLPSQSLPPMAPPPVHQIIPPSGNSEAGFLVPLPMSDSSTAASSVARQTSESDAGACAVATGRPQRNRQRPVRWIESRYQPVKKKAKVKGNNNSSQFHCNSSFNNDFYMHSLRVNEQVAEGMENVISSAVQLTNNSFADKDDLLPSANLIGTTPLPNNSVHNVPSPSFCNILPSVSLPLPDTLSAVSHSTPSVTESHNLLANSASLADVQPGSSAQVSSLTTASSQAGVQPGDRGAPCVVWIIGHSFVFWAETRASLRYYGLNLGLDDSSYKVLWFGCRGMSWFELQLSICARLSSHPQPSIIILHVAGNDLGFVKTLDLVAQMKTDLTHLHDILPSSVLVFFFFSEIIPRLKWLVDPTHFFLEKIRRRVNRFLEKFMPLINGLSFRHVDLEGGLPGLYRSDQVHLSAIGNDIFHLDFIACIELAVARVGCQAP